MENEEQKSESIPLWKRREPLLPFNAEGLITFYNAMFRPQGFSLPDHLYPVANALMDERLHNLGIIIGPGAGKSLLISVCYPAFLLGHRPSTTILNISAGEGLVQGFMKAIMDWIEWSPQWNFFFPNVKPDKDVGWSTERGIFVTGHERGDPDASYFVAGLTSSVITGKHAKVIIMDDIHNRENSSTALQCQGVVSAYYDTLVGRANPSGARFIGAGRRWHEEDIYGHWKKSGDWVIMELPSFRKKSKELYWDIFIPENMTCCFNDRAAA